MYYNTGMSRWNNMNVVDPPVDPPVDPIQEVLLDNFAYTDRFTQSIGNLILMYPEVDFDVNYEHFILYVTYQGRIHAFNFEMLMRMPDLVFGLDNLIQSVLTEGTEHDENEQTTIDTPTESYF